MKGSRETGLNATFDALVLRRRYSLRNAAIGSILDARFAGA